MTKKEELRTWYIKTIGYDPFKNPETTVEDVEKIKEDYEEYAAGIMEDISDTTEIKEGM